MQRDINAYLHDFIQNSILIQLDKNDGSASEDTLRFEGIERYAGDEKYLTIWFTQEPRVFSEDEESDRRMILRRVADILGF
jgi:hypothetical protein